MHSSLINQFEGSIDGLVIISLLPLPVHGAKAKQWCLHQPEKNNPADSENKPNNFELRNQYFATWNMWLWRRKKNPFWNLQIIVYTPAATNWMDHICHWSFAQSNNSHLKIRCVGWSWFCKEFSTKAYYVPPGRSSY